MRACSPRRCELGGVPDVITPALGRATALAKAVVEQGQPITAALFGDLALEHQMLDRVTYLKALADAADHIDTRLLARRLQAAHQETIEWITSVLTQEAAGEPTAVRPTPVQKAVGRLTRAANYPTRWAAERINGTVEAVARTRSRAATVAEAAADSLSAGRDAGLRHAEQSATRKGATATATTLNRTRVLTGGLTEDELPVDNFDDLTVTEVRGRGATTHRPRRADRIAALRKQSQGPRGRPPPSRTSRTRGAAEQQKLTHGPGAAGLTPAEPAAARYMLAISRLTRSSTARNGSLHNTVRCAWSLSLRCTQSTVKSRPAA